MQKLILGLLISMILVIFASLVIAEKPLVVDDDGVECPKAGYTTIQAAVDAASPGDKIKVCAGVYAENVVIGKNDLTLISDGAVLDGSTLGNGDGITIQSGVSGLTIKYFEIQNYKGGSSGVGNAVQSWNCGTSDISVIGNYMHDNDWNAILVGNEGEALHERWSVKDNTVENNGFYNIELTNTKDSEIKNNVVTGPGKGVQEIGILLQARSWWQGGLNYLICDDPLEEIVVSGNVISSGNVVSGFEEGSSGGGEGIRLLAFAGAGGSATLTNTRVTENEVFDNEGPGILVFNFNFAGFGTGIIDNVIISENNVHDNGRDGIRFIDTDNSQVSDNTVTNNGQQGIRLGVGFDGSGSTGNQITDNTATGNGDGITYFDLFHDVTSTPNIWDENLCSTKSGADIPAC